MAGMAAVGPADDAYHYAQWKDGRHDVSYTEWWYFNVRDEQAGVSAIFSYFVTDPDDILGIGQARMVAVAYTAAGTVTESDILPPSAFSAAADHADVAIEAGTVEARSDGTYAVRGSSRDGRLSWDLVYTQASDPWFAADRLPIGSLAWEAMSWLVAMPRARVAGTIAVDGHAYPIDASGYHDHNWGEWIPADGRWNWAQVSTPRVALEMGDFIGKPEGLVALDLDGERTVFTHDQYTLTHTRWAWDPANRLFYPVESVLSADNGTLRVDVTMRATATDPLVGDLPAPLRDLIVYEQAASYSGAVREFAPATGGWRLRAFVSGTGFKEWTGKGN
jgi:hypothetical protein